MRRSRLQSNYEWWVVHDRSHITSGNSQDGRLQWWHAGSQVARVVNRLEDVPVRVPDLRPKRTTAPNEAGSWSSKEEEQKTLRK